MKENLFNENHIRTFTGKYLDVFNPDPDMICIEDIAHALSNICRWGGHTLRFYSVAQHSVRCSDYFSSDAKLQALMHDASEAYLLDIPRPIKHRLINYKATENRLMQVIAKKFFFPWPMHPDVKKADDIELCHEWNSVVIGVPASPWANSNNCWKPRKAERIFLETFRLIVS